MTLGSSEWPAIGTTARVVVTDAVHLRTARQLVVDQLAALDAACSRLRPDSEIAVLAAAEGAWTRVSGVLADVLACALEAARATDGLVDPTMGNDLILLGYDRDFAELAHRGGDAAGVASGGDAAGVASGAAAAGPRYSLARRLSWRDIELDCAQRTVRVPAGMVIDLGAIAKAWCADRCAELIAAELGVGVLVSLGGDIATAGSGPAGGWLVRVQDLPDADLGRACDAIVSDGFALATSSTISRSWRRGSAQLHHILDPATRRPATPVWRTVTVAAQSCVEANAASTAAVIRGSSAPRWLAELGLTARLVGSDGAIRTVGSWPEQAAA